MRGVPAAPQALTQREASTSAGAAPGGTHSGSRARKPLTSQLGVPGWILVGFVVAGGAVRAVACLALWPAATTLSDAATYAVDAASNPMADPQHPAGYPALLALIGVFTRSVAVPILLQHAFGIAAAVLLFAAVRRLVGSPWPALLPAAVVLLDTDEIFLEHNVMSEALFLFLLAVAIYASVRAIDAPARSAWRWAAVAGAVCVGSTIVRSAGLFGIPVLVVAMALSRPPAVRHRWRASATFLVVATVGLAGYGFANLAVNRRFELAPAAGWHLYARVGRFADCRRFTPPPGTAGLCESTPPSKRGWGPDFYLYAAQSPARRRFGRIGSHDGEVGSFAMQAILHQPAAMAGAVLTDVSRYFVPSARPHGWYTGWDIDPQLEWSRKGGPGYARGHARGHVEILQPVCSAKERLVHRLYERLRASGRIRCDAPHRLHVTHAARIADWATSQPHRRFAIRRGGSGATARAHRKCPLHGPLHRSARRTDRRRSCDCALVTVAHAPALAASVVVTPSVRNNARKGIS